jgi:putative hemolysin
MALQNGMEKTKLIDVREVLHQKAPKAAKRIPRFLVNYLIRVIRQDEMNNFVERHHDIDGVAFMQAFIDDYNISLETFGTHNIPLDGKKYIFASNHPLGGLDGICLGALLGKYYESEVSILVNDLLLFVPNLRSIFIPINKHGAQAKHSAQKIEEAFASDKQIVTFPAGLCSRKKKGEICDL